MRTFGEGKDFPKISLSAAHKRGEQSRWEVSKGRLVPLIASAAKIEKTLRGGAPYRGLLILCLPSAEHPLDIARLSEVSEYLPQLTQRGISVAAVMPEKPEILWRLKEGKGIAYPMFTDPEGRAAWQLGILDIRLREEGRPLPSLFFLDEKGTIQLRRTALHPSRRTPIEKVLKEIDRLCKKETPPGAGEGKEKGK
ncbi:MAG: redoxin domain-containing protein [Planctomycetota bacterium]